MVRRRKFSDEYKREAVQMALQPGVTKSQVAQEKTDHLIIEYDTREVSEEAVSVAKRDGERYYAVPREMLGYAPKERIVILLRGARRLREVFR